MADWERLKELLESVPRGSVGAELGVWRGDFSQLALDRVEPSVLHLIDPWHFVEDPRYEGAWYAGSVARDQTDMDAIYEEVRRRFTRERLSGQVVIHRMRSVEAAAEIPDESLDWVYVDGDHTYEAVRADLAAFWPKIRDGGIVAGDDYGGEGWWEGGVERAVDEFVLSHGCVLTVARRQFFFRKAESAPAPQTGEK